MFKFHESSLVGHRGTWATSEKVKEKYKGERLHIKGKFLNFMIVDASLSKEGAQRMYKKVCKYFLQGAYIWKHGKKRMGTPQRVICKKKE